HRSPLAIPRALHMAAAWSQTLSRERSDTWEWSSLSIPYRRPRARLRKLRSGRSRSETPSTQTESAHRSIQNPVETSWLNRKLDRVQPCAHLPHGQRYEVALDLD